MFTLVDGFQPAFFRLRLPSQPVISAERQNGYATQMLRLTLEKAKERGIEKVRICCDHYNVASAKTIRANGGVLEDEQFDSSDGTLTQRYWIQNK